MSDEIRRAWNRMLAVFRRKPLDADLSDEISAHLEAAIEDNLRAGMSPEEARRQALVRFGGLAQAMEHHREERGVPFLDVLAQDLRFAWRMLGRDRGFACVITLVLALGIGANVAVFSVVNAILLRPLPFHQPDRLVWFVTTGGRGLSDQTYTVAAYEEFRRHNRSFQDVTSYQTFFNSIQYKLLGQGAPVPVVGIQVAENFFPMLGVEPALGRQFTAEECQRGGRPAILLSHGFWMRQFAGDPSIVGRTLSIKAEPAHIQGPVSVVGVLPASFDFGAVFSPGMQVDFYVPAAMDYWRTWGNTMAVLGRLKPGVSLAQAQAEANTLFPQLRAANRGWWSDYLSTLSILQDRVSGRLRRSLEVLWAAVGLILLIVAINVSNLLLARTLSRGKEFAMRTALGAGRGRLVRQLLTESLVLSSFGAALGVGLAWALVFYLARQDRIALPLLATARVDAAALLWTVLLAVVVGAAVALVPALKISAGSLQEALKDSGAGLSHGRRHERLRSALVVAEVALACVLLVGAGLLLRSFLRLLDVDLGFRPESTAVMKIELPTEGKRERTGPVAQQLLERVRAIPGVDAAALSDMLPLERNRSWALRAKENPNNQNRSTFVYVVSPGYLGAMGMRLLRGRDLAWQDDLRTQGVVVINEAAARREWPGRDPLGRVGFIGDHEVQVVGVVADVRETSLEENSSPQMFLTLAQAPPEGAELVVRTRLPVSAVEPAVLSALRSINPGQPLAKFRTVRQIVNHSVAPRRFLMLLVTAFAGFGLVLASLGIYGVISYSVARQAQEIGIRMALGATGGQVQLGVVTQTLKLALAGIAIGSAAAYAVARSIASLLYGTQPADPIIFTAVVALLGAVALLAGQIPARRAATIDPWRVLRGV